MKIGGTVIVVILLASSIHATTDETASNEMCAGEKGNKVRLIIIVSCKLQ